jgi:hypothetical protein
MKKAFIFVAGLATGVLLLFVVAAVIYICDEKNHPQVQNNGVTMFDAPGDKIDETEFEVYQALERGSSALSRGTGINTHLTTYLLVNDEGKLYYDNEKVAVPSAKVARQVGIFEYETNRGIWKTVPIVKFLNK